MKNVGNSSRGVVRESRKFSGHPRIVQGALRGHLCDSTAFLSLLQPAGTVTTNSGMHSYITFHLFRETCIADRSWKFISVGPGKSWKSRWKWFSWKSGRLTNNCLQSPHQSKFTRRLYCWVLSADYHSRVMQATTTSLWRNSMSRCMPAMFVVKIFCTLKIWYEKLVQ